MELSNVMEKIVIDCINENIGNLNCCDCQLCKKDIAAYVLNRIPPKYVVTEIGELYTKVGQMNGDMKMEIMVQVIQAADVVRNSPRHKADAKDTDAKDTETKEPDVENSDT